MHVTNDSYARQLHKTAEKMAEEATFTALNVREMHLLIAEFMIHNYKHGILNYKLSEHKNTKLKSPFCF